MAHARPTDEPDEGFEEEAGGPQNVVNMTISDSCVNVASIRADQVVTPGPLIILSYGYRMQHYEPTDQSRDEALRARVPPEDLSHLFKNADLDRGLEEKIFIQVAKSFDGKGNWRWFARRLDTDKAVFNRLETNYSHEVRELVFQLLIFYKKRFPLKKIGDVVKALCFSRNYDQARALKDYFDQKQNETE
ncbi:hypothetical protein ACOMHN_011361 [Nucella lapillus]